MPFVSFSSGFVLDSRTVVSNIFIEQIMPTLNGDVVRVYLYGLYLCNSATRYDNTIGHFANTLMLSEDDIISAFKGLEELGLVQVLNLSPVEVKYLPPRSNFGKIKKFTKGKYDGFNAGIQAILDDGTTLNTRMITPHEYSEYYTLIESMHIEPDALLMIARYCVEFTRRKNKGTHNENKPVSHNYITTVAKNWAYSGIRTTTAVEEKLKQESQNTGTVVDILKALGSKRSPEPEDFALYEKWRRDLGFPSEVIIYTAKKTKGSFARLDTKLLKYFELKLFEKNDIENYENNKQDLVTLAREINKRIGVYYENVEPIIEGYIVNWQMKGYDDATLLQIASHCFRGTIRTLDGMDKVIAKFYKMGIVSTSALDRYLQDKVAGSAKIKELFTKLGLTREPNQIDSEFFTTWTEEWKIAENLLDYAISLARDKISPISYLNKVLGSFHEKGIKTADEAKKQSTQNATKEKIKEPKFERHTYTDEQLARIMTNFDDFEV